MKVSQEMLTKSGIKPQSKAQETNQQFNQLVAQEAKQLKEVELKGLIDDIQKTGERLSKFRSFQDLAKFKRMIKQFLQETVHDGLELQEESSFQRQKMTHLKTVKEVDEKVIELTEDVMDQEKSTVDLLGIIDEIKGLLVNIYM